MKIKYDVKIHKSGKHNNDILNIIAAHNGGEVPTSFPDLISYVSHQKALSPETSKGLDITRSEADENILLVSEDGGVSVTISIIENSLHELVSDNPNDLDGVL